MGIDPMVENEEYEDLFGITKQQYNHIGISLKEIQDFRVIAHETVLPPSEIDRNIKKEAEILKNYKDLSMVNYCYIL